MQVMIHQHQTRTAAIQSTQRVPSTLLMPLSGSHDDNRLFLSCRTLWTVSMLTPTVTFSDGVWFIWTTDYS